jgi:nitric oxide reductase subunit C
VLSKSQARSFFIVATGGFSLVFLGLTVDTVRQVPARSNEDQMTPQVMLGRELWDRNNCMGCHTILGEGAYYAPELTKAVERRGEEWLKVFLKDPEAMFPGKRKMTNYHFTAEEIDGIVAFLDWIGKIDTNGFPAKPDLRGPAVGMVANTGGDPHAGAPAKFGTVCVACHSLGGQGGNVGPALDHVASRYTQDKLDAWLADPTAVKPGTAMPNLQLATDEREELVRWLMTLQ